MSNNYRKIYEQHFGPIPVDSEGRTYDIHHIDGNHTNNDILNLKCVSIKEHYDIHYSQGDWGACSSILMRTKTSPEEIGKLSRKTMNQMVEKGTHPWLKGSKHYMWLKDSGFSSERSKETCRKQLENKTHPFLGGEVQRRTAKKRIASGEMQEVGRRTIRKLIEDKNPGVLSIIDGSNCRKRIENGTHNFLNSEFQSKQARERIKNGKSNILHILECPHCGKIGRGPGMKSGHFKNCNKINPRIWVYNDLEITQVKLSDKEKYLNLGYHLGRKHK